jgi:Phosphatidylglycerophosphate synthase
MITYKDVENRVMPPEKRAECKHDLFSFYIGRKITYIMTIPFLYTSISPDMITGLSILMLSAGFPIFCIAETKAALLGGWLLFFLWSLLDGVDGNVARYKCQFSKLGDIYDTMGGYMAIALMYFAAGIAAAHGRNGLLGLSRDNYIILGGLSSISGIFPRLMMHKVISSFMDSSIVRDIQDKAQYGIVKIAALNITSISGGSMVLLLAAVLTERLDVYTLVYFMLNLLKMIISLKSIFKGVKEAEK